MLNFPLIKIYTGEHKFGTTNDLERTILIFANNCIPNSILFNHCEKGKRLFRTVQRDLCLSVHEFIWIGNRELPTHMRNVGIGSFLLMQTDQCRSMWIGSPRVFRRSDIAPYESSV